ncbi:hypothetical protein SCP_0309990 [Sparassis crispa]|uniref:Asteroid domain-containing protein n=1 Tax=Sparassis crispa TaxID=139825 RepID=A0A401GGH8_9APHY|nr:hypothetical protein SCP_0309990 [Sparassis crispa]GBE81272.1 hypothetical protein SCP_0309990 [Sparassis crispa]
MGIHGLTTYLRENRGKLADTLEFRSGGDNHRIRTPIVVDGWSFIYEVMNCADLPWVYGGEYEAFSNIISRIVEGWLNVGLRLYFVFDGPYPSVKFPTIVSRMAQTNQGGLLFFRTSASARSSRRFLRETFTLPPLSYSVCVRTLLGIAAAKNCESARVIEVHFADEEGDPYAVALAGRLNAYVTGHDSDYVVLNTDGYKGYIPMDEVIWSSISLSPSVSRADSVYSSADGDVDIMDDGGFRPVRSTKKASKRAAANHREGNGIVPPYDPLEVVSEVVLTVTVYPPASLAEHLQLPVSLLPLLGALVGNDFTGMDVDWSPQRTSSRMNNLQHLFFERQLTLVQRIMRVANTLRSILSAALSSTAPKKTRKQVGSVIELIDAAVTALLLRPTDSMAMGEREAIVERIVEATLQYAIPRSELQNEVQDGEEDGVHGQELGDSATIWASNVCVVHTREECPLFASLSRLVSAQNSLAPSASGSVHEEDHSGEIYADNFRARLSELYISAYRRGAVSPRVLDILNTGTSWPRQFLEDPDKETVWRSVGRSIRELGYAILDEGLGLPVRPDDEEEDEEVDNDDDELVDVVEEEDDDLLAPLRGALEQLDVSGDEYAGDGMTEARPLVVSLPSSKTGRQKIVVEYSRRGTRLAPEDVSVPSLLDVLGQYSMTDEGGFVVPLQLWPEDARLTLFLRMLQSDVTRVNTLRGEVLMAVLAVRWVVRCMHTRAQESGGNREKDKERWTRHEAKAFLGAFSWTASGTQAHPESPQSAIPILERNVQLVAQVSAALESIQHLAQILLLHDRVPSPAHLFSGQRFHELLTAIGKEAALTVDQEMWEASIEAQQTAFAEPRSKKARKETKGKDLATAPLPSGISKRGKDFSAMGGMFGLLADADV